MYVTCSFLILLSNSNYKMYFMFFRFLQILLAALDSALIITCSLSFTPIILLSKNKCPKRFYYKGILEMGCTLFLHQSSSPCAFILSHFQDLADTIAVWNFFLYHPKFPIVSKVLNISNPSFHSNNISGSCVFYPLEKAHQLLFPYQIHMLLIL